VPRPATVTALNDADLYALEMETFALAFPGHAREAWRYLCRG
jgi:hypothetical protein